MEGEIGEGGGVNLFAESVEGDGGEGGDVVGVDDEERIGGFDCCWKGVLCQYVFLWVDFQRWARGMRTSTPCVNVGLG